jgi:hypothetical protein
MIFLGPEVSRWLEIPSEQNALILLLTDCIIHHELFLKLGFISKVGESSQDELHQASGKFEELQSWIRSLGQVF